MKFRTELQPSPSNFTITHSKTSLFIGSCFSDSMGELFRKNWFNFLSNPLGTVYNSTSVLNQLQAITNTSINHQHLETDGSKFYHFDFHSHFSGKDAKEVANRISNTLESAQSFFPKCSVFFITLGSAYVYKLRTTGNTVANCHKLPSSLFDKHLMSSEEVYNDLVKISKLIKSHLPDAKIVLTVSPVRHIKDGIVENNRSKANLISAVHKAVEDEELQYFPSYELLLDDLRDYRFYTKDLIHPSDQAIEYIWEFFKNTFFDPVTKGLLEKIAKVNSSILHRPFDSMDPAYLSHINKTKAEIKMLTEAYPQLCPPVL